MALLIMLTETCVRTIEPDITVYTISGSIHLGNRLMSLETAIKRLIAEGTRKLVIDLAGLHHIDSAGIGMLMISNAEMEKNGGQLRIAGASGLVAKSFAIVHLQRIVVIEADVESACRSLSPPLP
jgi:anti-sigma B factor antagonist